MTTPDTASERAAMLAKQRRRREVAAAVVGALLAAFALLNLGEVKVDWIVTSAGTPLIVVIALSVLLGIVLDRLLIRRKRRRRSAVASAATPDEQTSPSGRTIRASDTDG
jgi:uncharacterized integral membrane protein